MSFLAKSSHVRYRSRHQATMSSPDSPKHLEERERRSRSPKGRERRSRSRDGERDSKSGRRFNEERPRVADGPGEKSQEARKFEWRREPASERPRADNPMERPRQRGRMDRPHHATGGGEQQHVRQVERSKAPESMGPSSIRREPGHWSERKPTRGMAWGHDDRQAPDSNRQTSQGRSDQADRWQRDMFKGSTAETVDTGDESRRSAFANFEF